MAHISRSQLLVYGALAVVVLLVGARWVSASESAPAAGEPAFTPGSGGGSGASGAPDPGANAQDRGQASAPAAPPALVLPGDRDALVHVAGAVRNPGVYRLPVGARVADAVERAGGASPRAEVSGINLAARLSDGQQIIVPLRSGTGSGGGDGGNGSAANAGSSAGQAGPIGLGSATTQQLETIDGIGPVTAAAIIEFRDQRGGLASIDELDEVRGIGPATLEALRSRLQP